MVLRGMGGGGLDSSGVEMGWLDGGKCGGDGLDDGGFPEYRDDISPL